MSTDLQDPQQQFFKFNMWLGIAVVVLLMLLIATAIAPYIHFGTIGDTETIMNRLNELEKMIQVNPAGGLTVSEISLVDRTGRPRRPAD